MNPILDPSSSVFRGLTACELSKGWMVEMSSCGIVSSLIMVDRELKHLLCVPKDSVIFGGL